MLRTIVSGHVGPKTGAIVLQRRVSAFPINKKLADQLNPGHWNSGCSYMVSHPFPSPYQLCAGDNPHAIDAWRISVFPATSFHSRFERAIGFFHQYYDLQLKIYAQEMDHEFEAHANGIIKIGTAGNWLVQMHEHGADNLTHFTPIQLILNEVQINDYFRRVAEETKP